MASSLEALLERILTTSGSPAERGSRFEDLMVSYFRTAAEYADRFSEVHRWQDWEGRQGRADHGIDIVAREVDGGWCAIQCKYYAPSTRIAKDDIDSFLSASGKAGFTSRMIVSTTDHWGSTAEATIADQQVPVQRVGLANLVESNIDWDAVDFERPAETLPTTERKEPRAHQREAVDAVAEAFLTHDRGKLIMACGTGKTYTALRIAQDLATSRKAEPTCVLFLVPSISLLDQSLREWKRDADVPFRAYAVCSDTKVGRRRGQDARDVEDISTHDLLIPATTDPAALATSVLERQEDDQFTVTFATYQSIDVVARAQQQGLPTLDLVVCDEAHRTTGVTVAGEDESHFVRVHDNDYLAARKRLYMTATPRLFDDSAKQRAKDAEAVLASMDDEAVFGPEIHRLGFGEAVERGLLSDYKVLVLTVDEAYVAKNFQQQVAQDGEIQLGDAAKIIGCWNGLAKQFGQATGRDNASEGSDSTDRRPMRRAVAFAKDIRSSKAITANFPQIVERHLTASERPQDELAVQARHVDGTQNALERRSALAWLTAGADEGDNTCRILSNARCLSEGVDVPALDAVMFLTPRSSQVDVVQSVGRVMRRAEGKEVGYIILPIVVPAGVPADEALRDNERYKVVWQVLQALRAHDDRFNAMINQIDLNTRRPDRVQVIGVPGARGDGDGAGDEAAYEQAVLSFDIGQWRDAIYAKIVAKCGERRYWESWAGDVAEIARNHIVRINGLLADPGSPASHRFEGFLEGLRGNLNEGIGRDDAVEMLAQHLITRPIFQALFAGYDFAARNPVARTMEGMLTVLDEHTLASESRSLERFYESAALRIKDIDNAEGRQRILVELYDKFFAKAFRRQVDKLGIVYTPVEIVDFILRSADDVLRAEFGQGLTDEGVHVLDGFTGTGTFLVRLLQSGLIEPHDLARKYAGELHANEILLLAYYIAAVNIETTHQDLVQADGDAAGLEAPYEPFTGLMLTDTFQSYEDGDRDDLHIFPANNERITRQRGLPITVVVGNPPYSSGQDSANDANPNERYPTIDSAIRDTYAARSTAKLKNSLYDSYIRAIKWASLRIEDRGVIALVTNGGFLDSNTADGMRLSLAEEFSAIHIVNLRGNARTAGDLRKREGGSVFASGSKATVAITILVKNPGHTGTATISYTDIGDYLTRGQKLAKIAQAGRLAGLEPVTLTSSDQGDWLSHRADDFPAFIPVGDKDDTSALLATYSGGLKTNRDAWVYNSSRARVHEHAARSLDFYNSEVRRFQGWQAGRQLDDPYQAADEFIDRDSRRISWDRVPRADVARGKEYAFRASGIRRATYRPFTRSWVYFDRQWNNTVYQLPRLFPTAEHDNIGMLVMSPRNEATPAVLMVDAIPDLSFYTYTAQFFPRWSYEAVDDEDTLLQVADSEVVDGYRRVDNVTDEALRRWRAAYGPDVTKDDVFHYVYGLLHSPDYRATYAADLKKMLPRIPLVEDAQPFVDAGWRLSEIHLGYESAEPYPLEGLTGGPTGTDEAAYRHFRVEKMRFAGKGDRSTIVYNDRITLGGIPEEAYHYQLGSRSAVGGRVDHGPLPGAHRREIRHRQRPERLVPRGRRPAVRRRPVGAGRDGEPGDDAGRRRPAAPAHAGGAARRQGVANQLNREGRFVSDPGLVRRAAEHGISVPELLRQEAAWLAAQPSVAAWLRQAGRGSSPVERAEILSALDEQRGSWPDAGR